MLRRRTQRMSYCLLGLLLSLVCGLTVACGQDNTSATSKTMTVGVNPTISVDIGNGSVSLHTGGSGTVVVNATKHSSGSPNDVAVDYTQASSTQVSISSHQGGGFTSNSVDLDIAVPAQSTIDVKTGSGSIQANGTNGSLHLESGNGSISATNVQGTIFLKTDSGDITTTSVKGQITANTSNGDIHMNQMTLQTQAVVQTDRGSVSFEGSLNSRGTYQFETSSGTVDLTLPGNSAFHLNATVGNGSVTNAFGSNDVGSQPQAQLNVRSSDALTLKKE